MILRDELVQTLMQRIDTRSEGSTRDHTVDVWHRLLGKFSPLIGPASVHVLFMRCLEANRANHPWLPPVLGDDAQNTLFSTFEATLATQACADIVSATRAMLSTYIDSLFALIGTTLTVQFVCSAFRGDASQQ